MRNAKDIDYLISFDHSIGTWILCCIYKLINRKGKFYCKLDAGPTLVEQKESQNIFKRYVHRMINKIYLKWVDVASVESMEAFTAIKNSNNKRLDYGNKLLFIPNGFDEELLTNLQMKEKSFEEKENIFITIGRLGTTPKNTEMLLAALEKVDLKDWKFYCIGPVEESFRTIISDFYKAYPEKINNVIFTGPIYDKRELWEYLNRAKVFVLCSRWESYGLVLNEAKRFKNYLLSTEVGAFLDLVENGKYGMSIQMDDAEDLAEKMRRIIRGEQRIDVYKDFDVSEMSYEHLLKEVAEKLK